MEWVQSGMFLCFIHDISKQLEGLNRTFFLCYMQSNEQVATQLGLLDDAVRLYRECGHYDLLNRLYQARPGVFSLLRGSYQVFHCWKKPKTAVISALRTTQRSFSGLQQIRLKSHLGHSASTEKANRILALLRRHLRDSWSGHTCRFAWLSEKNVPAFLGGL